MAITGARTANNGYAADEEEFRWSRQRRLEREVNQFLHALHRRLERLDRVVEVDRPCCITIRLVPGHACDEPLWTMCVTDERIYHIGSEAGHPSCKARRTSSYCLSARPSLGFDVVASTRWSFGLFNSSTSSPRSANPDACLSAKV